MSHDAIKQEMAAAQLVANCEHEFNPLFDQFLYCDKCKRAAWYVHEGKYRRLEIATLGMTHHLKRVAAGEIRR